MDTMADIQYQSCQGNWVSLNTTPNQPDLIRQAMQGLKSIIPPNYRVRAVGMETRQLLDML